VKKEWKMIARYNVTQALKTVFGDIQIDEEEKEETEIDELNKTKSK
jgi:hypothetical protein